MTLDEAEKILHDAGYITVDVNERNQKWAQSCHAVKKANCRKNSIGYMCCNMVCISEYVKEQIG